MPQVYNSALPKGVYLWRATESEQELRQSVVLTEQERTTLSGISSAVKRTEKLATRALLQQALGSASRIVYRTDGSPMLADRTETISISHAKGYVALYVAGEGKVVGIDIEPVLRSASSLVGRVITPHEASIAEKVFGKNPALLAWCAKEAMFKAAQADVTENFDYIRDLKLVGAETTHGAIKNNVAGIAYGKEIALQFTVIKELLIVWTV